MTLNSMTLISQRSFFYHAVHFLNFPGKKEKQRVNNTPASVKIDSVTLQCFTNKQLDNFLSKESDEIVLISRTATFKFNSYDGNYQLSFGHANNELASNEIQERKMQIFSASEKIAQR